MVLQQGRAEQIEYYKERVKGIDRRKRQALTNIFVDVPLGETMDAEDIMSALENEYPPEVAEALFNKVLERGIIDEREDGDYGIPIPSFHSWLVDEYAKDKSQDILPPPKGMLLDTESISPTPAQQDQEGEEKEKDAGEDKHKGSSGFSIEQR